MFLAFSMRPRETFLFRSWTVLIISPAANEKLMTVKTEKSLILKLRWQLLILSEKHYIDKMTKQSLKRKEEQENSTGWEWKVNAREAKLCSICTVIHRSRLCTKDHKQRVGNRAFEIVKNPHECMVTGIFFVYDHHYLPVTPLFFFLHFDKVEASQPSLEFISKIELVVGERNLNLKLTC